VVLLPLKQGLSPANETMGDDSLKQIASAC
jgi:hypothetical protein